MEFLRAIADCAQFAAVMWLVVNMAVNKCCEVISVKTQIIYSLVYIGRFAHISNGRIDSFFEFLIGPLLIFMTGYIVYLMLFPMRKTYEEDRDSFKFELLLLFAGILAACVHHEFTFLEFMWCFSLYLESVASLPQFYMCIAMNTITRPLCVYFTVLFLCRILYFTSWIYPSFEIGIFDLITLLPSALQILSYPVFMTLLLINKGTEKPETEIVVKELIPVTPVEEETTAMNDDYSEEDMQEVSSSLLEHRNNMMAVLASNIEKRGDFNVFIKSVSSPAVLEHTTVESKSQKMQSLREFIAAGFYSKNRDASTTFMF